MDFSFNYAPATEAADTGFAAFKAAQHDFDRSNIQITMIKHKGGSQSTFCYMPMLSHTAALVMYACPRACLGESAEFLISGCVIPCNLANIKAWLEPAQWIPVPDQINEPVYRSLGGGLAVDDGGDGGGKAAVPVAKLPPSNCIKNIDGSCTFVLKVAEFVKSDADIAKAIESKEYPDKVAYLLALGKACFESLTAGMDANGVDKSKIFLMSEDDKTKVDPCVIINFWDELYPKLRANHDMLVCIPGPDKDGNLQTAVSFAFHYPDARRCQPMPGLVHNIDHSTASTEQAVEEGYYISSNVKVPMTIDNNDTGITTKVGLCSAKEFLPYDLIPSGYRMSVDHSYNWYCYDKDYDAWIHGCKIFQVNVQNAYWDSIAAVCDKMGLPDFDKKNFYSTNLVGRFVAKNATSVNCGKDLRECEGANVISRMKAAREATEERAKKRQARSPVASVDGMEVEGVHNERTLHLLNSLPGDFVEMALTLCRGMNPDYVDMSGVGFGRFKINSMTEAHMKDLMRFAEHLLKTH